MWRVVPLGLAALLILPGARAQEKQKDDVILQVEGKLTDDDPKDMLLKKSPHKVHECKLSAGGIYVIDMKSKDFDTFLRLEDSKKKQLAFNDDIAPPNDLNSRIVIKAPADDTYRIIATAFMGTGAYTLTARKGTQEDLAKADPFYNLIGKPAPELIAEYSFNGDTKKLSDLKGKVVLVDFWAVWCGPCIQTFPHLREWRQEHQKGGLEILGVTTYFEVFAFDKDKGQLKRLGKENNEKNLKPAEEHDMLKDFVTYHKLQHRIMAVTKDNWQKAAKDYNVRGIPHVALLDRKGIIRMVRVGSSPENAEAIHDEIKKLIAEK
jgi:thiol-disulfide isomerase/thioredoxin